MNPTARRVLRRHLYGSIYRTLTTPVVLADSGIVVNSDLVRLLALNQIHVSDLEFSHPDYLPRNFLAWKGIDEDGEPIQGELRFHLAHGRRQAMVSAEIAILNVDPSRVTFRHTNTESALDVESIMRLIATISRQAIADLRENPTDVKPIIRGLVDIVDLIESWNWFEHGPIRD